MICQICSSPMSEPVQELCLLPSVTSDSRPWSAGRTVQVCPGCGVMKRVTSEYLSKDIYADYKMFDHSGGNDQINFSGVAEGRTSKILNFVSDIMPVPKSVLDIGSGSGAGLKSLSRRFPEASIYGFEPHADLDKEFPYNIVVFRNRPINEKFDLITLFHVFEHVEDIHEMLSYIKSSLTPEGHVLIQVPYVLEGAFDLVIADHVWHFTKKSLVKALNASGFSVAYVGNECIRKEITVVAYLSDSVCEYMAEERTYADIISWLLSYKSFLDNITESKVAIYGSGPTAAWVGSILDDKVAMYLDDDQCRLGAMFNGIPIRSTDWLDKGFPVVAPFPDWQLEEIKAKNPTLRFLC